MEERIKHEKQIWEQDQNYVVRRELAKLNEEKTKEIAKIQEDLNNEREKYLMERDKIVRLEKVSPRSDLPVKQNTGGYEYFASFQEIDELNQELKFANKEKTQALTKAKDSLRAEFEKIKQEAQSVRICDKF